MLLPTELEEFFVPVLKLDAREELLGARFFRLRSGKKNPFSKGRSMRVVPKHSGHSTSMLVSTPAVHPVELFEQERNVRHPEVIEVLPLLLRINALDAVEPR